MNQNTIRTTARRARLMAGAIGLVVAAGTPADDTELFVANLCLLYTSDAADEVVPV